jgi:hypothetical protein
MDEDTITKEDIKAWQKLPFTKRFFAELLESIEARNKDVHRCLQNQDLLYQAALHEAARVALVEVYNGPKTMIGE